jgi:C1A family cysteine protease
MNFLNIFKILLLFGFASSSLIDRFRDWVDDYKILIKNDDHEMIVFEKWAHNDKYIEDFNSKNYTFILGHNQFSGMDSNEFSAYLGYSKKYEPLNNLRGNDIKIDSSIDGAFASFASLPLSVDWVENGAVTDVKDQGQCGSCWSFSTTGSLEGAYYIKYGELISFSEQQLVDCDNLKNGGRDHGCNGGLMDNAYSWISKNGGLCSESSYPYISGTKKTSGTCMKTCSLIDGSIIDSFVDVTPNSDIAMMSALVNQPVSIAIEADQKEFQLYKSGIFTGSCGTNLDHGVLLVGYGTFEDDDYYLVKNSWGTTWGADGYIYLGRGSQYNDGAGQCGLLMEGSYPVL